MRSPSSPVVKKEKMELTMFEALSFSLCANRAEMYWDSILVMSQMQKMATSEVSIKLELICIPMLEAA